MSLAIKFGNVNDSNSISGFIYFDAVTDYSRSYGGKVTSHPIDAGASVSDHFVSDNPRFRVNAVVSGVDLSAIPSKILIDNEAPLNTNLQPNSISVNNFYSNLTSILPASVLQFIESNQFTIDGGGGLRKNYKKEVSFLIENLIKGLYYNENRKKWENRMTPITLYEMEGETFTDAYNNLILINANFSEGVDNWDALNADFQFEQVRFVTLEKVDAPKTSKKGASTTKEKGKVVTKPEPVPETQQPKKPTPTVLGQVDKVIKGVTK